MKKTPLLNEKRKTNYTMRKIAILLFLTVLTTVGMAQDNTFVVMNASSNGGTFTMQPSTEGGLYLWIYNEVDASTGKYVDGPYDRHITLDTSHCEGERAMGLYFDQFDIDPGDTLFIYDGPSINSPLLFACNNSLNPQIQTTVFASPINLSGKLTLRFKTNGDGNTGSGFHINVQCRDKCETIIPVIDSFYYKTRNGVIVDTGYTRWVRIIDTNWNADSTDFTLDSQIFKGIHLCLGEGVIFSAHGEYTQYYGYQPSDGWSMFEWNFGNGDDSAGIALTRVPARYRDLDCYDVTLRITDSRGCRSTILESAKVRVAQNPIKTLYDLNPICTTDSVIVSTGVGEGMTIGTRLITFGKTKSRSIDCKTFIPDGQNQNCAQEDAEHCFRASITFDDFPAGRVVQSASDICSICINMEHSYLGDVGGRIICPTDKKVALWYGTVNKDQLLPPDSARIPGTYNGGGHYLGIVYGGSNDGNGDDLSCSVGNAKCDSICNMYGVGFDYCFSKNANYTLVHGDPCDKTNPVPHDYFCDWNNLVDTTITDYSFIAWPPPFSRAGYTAPNSTFHTRKPSKHEGKYDYYLPAGKFSELEGCPLNGEWTIQICDNWPADNGWIFSWSIDFCGISAGEGCEYQVAIDSVIWEVDSAYGDYDLGYFRGPKIENRYSTRSIITSHDTAGVFPLNVHIYDEFGCVWDTSLNMTTVWSPTPELGDDLLICDVEQVVLDASDRHTPIANQSFMWEPFGQSTDTILTKSAMGSSTLYTVQVENDEHGIVCTTRDSVRVNVNHQPAPNFDPGVYPLEGCEPYTIHFDNTSQWGNTYLWVFGDGDSSTAMSPSHTYGTGQYDFKYYVRSEYGCTDSLVYKDLITVYSSPVARFSWEPMNPTVMHPEVTFQNLTVPQADDNKYYWEIQYDRDNTISYHTLRDVNPTFEWYSNGDDISGNYVARLIAMTQNMGPSGNIVECRDTVENTILLVNDFLQFPTAVTPNGDGVNDIFVIKNLIDGLGYPNNSLAIYDRWGKRVYYKENISKESDFWDPAADNIPDGTYFWRFTGRGYLGDIQRNGVVEVIR